MDFITNSQVSKNQKSLSFYDINTRTSLYPKTFCSQILHKTYNLFKLNIYSHKNNSRGGNLGARSASWPGAL